MILNQPLYFSIDSSKPDASFLISKKISDLLYNYQIDIKNVVILCIGTDRSTGDCLGPLVGDKLSKLLKAFPARIFGTLNEPVHAKNLKDTVDEIYSIYDKPFIIAIDASLGRIENIGKINIFKGPLYPGAGINKNLIPVGDIAVTGIVNISGYMEYIVLQSTRLSLVMQLADTITLGLFSSLNKLQHKMNSTPNS